MHEQYKSTSRLQEEKNTFKLKYYENFAKFSNLFAYHNNNYLVDDQASSQTNMFFIVYQNDTSYTQFSTLFSLLGKGRNHGFLYETYFS